MTKKERAKVTKTLGYARARLKMEAGYAVYWAHDARRKSNPDPLGSMLIAMFQRQVAQGWRAEVKKLEAKLAGGA